MGLLIDSRLVESDKKSNMEEGKCSLCESKWEIVKRHRLEGQ